MLLVISGSLIELGSDGSPIDRLLFTDLGLFCSGSGKREAGSGDGVGIAAITSYLGGSSDLRWFLMI